MTFYCKKIFREIPLWIPTIILQMKTSINTILSSIKATKADEWGILRCVHWWWPSYVRRSLIKLFHGFCASSSREFNEYERKMLWKFVNEFFFLKKFVTAIMLRISFLMKAMRDFSSNCSLSKSLIQHEKLVKILRIPSQTDARTKVNIHQLFNQSKPIILTVPPSDSST